MLQNHSGHASKEWILHRLQHPLLLALVTLRRCNGTTIVAGRPHTLILPTAHIPVGAITPALATAPILGVHITRLSQAHGAPHILGARLQSPDCHQLLLSLSILMANVAVATRKMTVSSACSTLGPSHRKHVRSNRTKSLP